MTQVPPPRLSVVAAARNDNHGGNLLRRMQSFVNGLLTQCERHRLPVELIVVEWNPPEDRPPLREALSVPHRLNHAALRIVTVPAEAHATFDHSEALPLFQMIAKNVGIRRARAPFVLATNVDLVFSDALMQRLAGRLRPRRMYRVDRTDVAQDFPHDASLDVQLQWCEQNIIRLNAAEATYDRRDGSVHRILHPMDRKAWLLEKLQDFNLVPVVTRKRLHLNGCGDFTLLHRDDWAHLRGYPEFHMFSMHLDSVLCTAAHFAGCREVVWPAPARCFHIEHAVGSGWSVEGQAKLESRIDKAGVPRTSDQQLGYTLKGMRRRRAPRIYNEADWGLAGHSFVDQTVEAAAVVAETTRPADPAVRKHAA
ncbi:MAG: hypothetical protein AAF288_00160 [Planctomycetota bacterium]